MLKLTLPKAVSPKQLELAIIEALGFPKGTVLTLDMDHIHVDGLEVNLEPGFIKSLEVQVLVSELDGVHDDPEIYFTEDSLYRSFTEWTGCSKEEYLSGKYDKEHNEGLILRLYGMEVKP